MTFPCLFDNQFLVKSSHLHVYMTITFIHQGGYFIKILDLSAGCESGETPFLPPIY